MFVKTIGIFDVFVGATGYYINLPATSEFKLGEWLTLKEVEEYCNELKLEHIISKDLTLVGMRPYKGN